MITQLSPLRRCRFVSLSPVDRRRCRIRSLHEYALLAAALLGVALLSRSVTAGPDCGQLRAEDELWIVSTRHLGCHCPADAPTFHVRRYDEQHGWQDVDADELTGAQSAPGLVVYIHGNRVSSCDAISEGWRVYRALVSDAEAPPVALVIWSWPSTQIRGQLRDVRVKALRADVESCYLARWLADVPGDRAVSLIGFSYGARIATGALHLAAGGTILGWRMPPESPARVEMRVVLMAAALHNYWLRPGSYHGQALSRVDLLLNLYNGCDRVLRRYHVVERCANPQALGYTGMYTGQLGESGQRVRQHNVCCSIGSAHGAGYYFANAWVRQQIQQVTLWQPVLEEADAAAADGTGL